MNKRTAFAWLGTVFLMFVSMAWWGAGEKLYLHLERSWFGPGIWALGAVFLACVIAFRIVPESRRAAAQEPPADNRAPRRVYLWLGVFSPLGWLPMTLQGTVVAFLDSHYPWQFRAVSAAISLVAILAVTIHIQEGLREYRQAQKLFTPP